MQRAGIAGQGLGVGGGGGVGAGAADGDTGAHAAGIGLRTGLLAGLVVAGAHGHAVAGGTGGATHLGRHGRGDLGGGGHEAERTAQAERERLRRGVGIGAGDGVDGDGTAAAEGAGHSIVTQAGLHAAVRACRDRAATGAAQAAGGRCIAIGHGSVLALRPHGDEVAVGHAATQVGRGAAADDGAAVGQTKADQAREAHARGGAGGQVGAIGQHLQGAAGRQPAAGAHLGGDHRRSIGVGTGTHGREQQAACRRRGRGLGVLAGGGGAVVVVAGHHQDVAARGELLVAGLGEHRGAHRGRGHRAADVGAAGLHAGGGGGGVGGGHHGHGGAGAGLQGATAQVHAQRGREAGIGAGELPAQHAAAAREGVGIDDVAGRAVDHDLTACAAAGAGEVAGGAARHPGVGVGAADGQPDRHCGVACIGLHVVAHPQVDLEITPGLQGDVAAGALQHVVDHRGIRIGAAAGRADAARRCRGRGRGTAGVGHAVVHPHAHGEVGPRAGGGDARTAADAVGHGRVQVDIGQRHAGRQRATDRHALGRAVGIGDGLGHDAGRATDGDLRAIADAGVDGGRGLAEGHRPGGSRHQATGGTGGVGHRVLVGTRQHLQRRTGGVGAAHRRRGAARLGVGQHAANAHGAADRRGPASGHCGVVGQPFHHHGTGAAGDAGVVAHQALGAAHGLGIHHRAVDHQAQARAGRIGRGAHVFAVLVVVRPDLHPGARQQRRVAGDGVAHVAIGLGHRHHHADGAAPADRQAEGVGRGVSAALALDGDVAAGVQRGVLRVHTHPGAHRAVGLGIAAGTVGGCQAAARGVGIHVGQVARLGAHRDGVGIGHAAQQLGLGAAIGTCGADADAEGHATDGQGVGIGPRLVVVVGQHAERAASRHLRTRPDARQQVGIGIGRGHGPAAGEAAEARRLRIGDGATARQRVDAAVVVAGLHTQQATRVQHRRGAHQGLHGGRELGRRNAGAGAARTRGDGDHRRIGLAGGHRVDRGVAGQLDQRLLAGAGAQGGCHVDEGEVGADGHGAGRHGHGGGIGIDVGGGVDVEVADAEADILADAGTVAHVGADLAFAAQPGEAGAGGHAAHAALAGAEVDGAVGGGRHVHLGRALDAHAIAQRRQLVAVVGQH